MTPELQKYYEDRLDMMSSQGWKDLIDDIEKMFEATNDVASIQDEKTLHFRRGELSMMNWFINLKKVSEEALEELQKDETVNRPDMRQVW